MKTCPNQHGDLRILFTEDSLKIKKGAGTSFQTTVSMEFFDKKFYFVILHKLTKFHYQTVYLPSYSIICVSCLVFDDIITFEYLKSQNLIISRAKRAFEVK